MIWIFLNRATALLAVLPDRHDAIACINSAYKEWTQTKKDNRTY